MATTQIRGAQVTDTTITDADIAAANKDGAAGTPCMRTLGAGSQQAAPGSHTHDHSAITGVSADQHHARSHNHSAAADGNALSPNSLNVGSAAGAGAGDVKMSGAVRQSTALGCRAYRDSNQTIPNATWTPLNLNQERFDNNGIHDTVTNNSRLTCQTAGIYYIFGNMMWTLNSVGLRGAAIRLNGSPLIAHTLVKATDASFGNGMNVSCIYNLAVGDYVELVVCQNTGGNLNTDYWAGNYVYHELGMVRIA